MAKNPGIRNWTLVQSNGRHPFGYVTARGTPPTPEARERPVSTVAHDVDWVGIVDDDESMRHCLGRVLSMHGINARAFRSAEDYLSRVGAGLPRCLVLDIQLGGLTGFELQDLLRSEGRDPPIIFITGMADVPTEELSARSGVGGYLRKPFDMKSLMDLVRGHVG